jgi:hypothetical protein
MPIGLAAIAGLLVPEVTKGISGLLSEWQAGREHKRRLEMLKLAHDNEIELGELKVFEKAQMELSGGMTVPPQATTAQTWLCLAVNASIHAVRPLLTAGALGVLVYILVSTTGDKRDALLDEIVLTCVAILRYWFGYREELRKKGKSN